MKLTVFQSGNGDCLLVEGRDGTRMLVDGGLASSYREHVAPAMSALERAGEQLDVICVSHVDGDHIGGVLALLEAEFKWRVFAFQSRTGNTRFRKPSVPRPPAVGELWHNGFSEQTGADPRPIAELLSQNAGTLELSDDDELLAAAEFQRELANSAGHGIRLSHRIGERQLDVPLNPPADGKLLMVRDGQRVIRRGTLRMTLLAPFQADVKNLQTEWHEWVRANADELALIREQTRRDLERLNLDEVGSFRAALAQSAGRLGDRTQVTPPNLASIMLLVREGGKTLLLTGDGHGDDILKGLERARAMPSGAGLHVDVFKVPHHGSEFNVDTDTRLYQRITADHYVICANGSHHNPDRRIVELLLASRLDDTPPRPFKLWFNSSPSVAGDAEHMREVQDLVRRREAEHPGRFEATFLETSSFEFEP